jgi:chemotaxis methyl-accepting protein methylase
VLRRLERRMQVRGVADIAGIPALLEARAGEYKLLLNDLLIGVTNFFRDREAFDMVERDVLPAIFRDRKPGDEVRAWTAGCATGEEAYSMAMLLADQAAQMPAAQLPGVRLGHRRARDQRGAHRPVSDLDRDRCARRRAAPVLHPRG